MRKVILGILLLFGATLTANAQDNGFYVGLSIGQGNIDVDDEIVDLDGDETGFKFIAGMRLLNWLAVEANYVDFGDVEEQGLQASSNGISAFGVAFLPIGPVDVFAKAGLVQWETTIEARGFGDIFRDDGTDPVYGAGLQFRFLSFAVRAEYEQFDLDNVDDVSMVSLGFTYTFL